MQFSHSNHIHINDIPSITIFKGVRTHIRRQSNQKKTTIHVRFSGSAAFAGTAHEGLSLEQNDVLKRSGTEHKSKSHSVRPRVAGPRQ